jgi:hypothetical protein
LTLLGAKGCRTVAYVDGLNPEARRQFQSPTLRLEPHRLDLARAARECDAAVLHARQGATARVLLAARPVLQLPLVLEQQLTARATTRLGAGETAPPRDTASVARTLDAVVSDRRYADAARRFAANHSDFDPQAQLEKMVGRVEELLGRNPAGRAEGAGPMAEAAWARPAEPRRPASVFRA